MSYVLTPTVFRVLQHSWCVLTGTLPTWGVPVLGASGAELGLGCFVRWSMRTAFMCEYELVLTTHIAAPLRLSSLEAQL